VKIRTQLTLYLGPFVLIIVAAILGLNYYLIRNALIQKAKDDLIKIEQSMGRSSDALLGTAIVNYLRGITEANLNIIEDYYTKFRTGKITEQEAKDAIHSHFLTEHVGKSGYPVAVKRVGDKLFLDIHPYQRGFECTNTEGCQQWNKVRNGYTEYDWKNPTENSFRKKAAYVREFPEWNWIIGASSYRDEFVDLVRIDDLRKLIQPGRINSSGFFYVFDKNYKILIHPELEGTDGKLLVDAKDTMILQRLQESKSGFITYQKKDSSTGKNTLKYATILKLEGYNWYLVATGSYCEVLKPVEHFRKVTIVMVLFACAALILLIYLLSRKITRPLVVLEQAVTEFYTTQEPMSWPSFSVQEVDVLGNAFAQMTGELAHSMQTLQEKVIALAISEQEKVESWQLLDSIINSMPSVIIGITPEMHVNKWNNRAETLSKRTRTEVHGLHLKDALPEIKEYLDVISGSMIKQESNVVNYECKDSLDHTRICELTVYPLVSNGNKGAVIRIDEITDRVEMEQRLRQSQKMDAIGQLAGGIAHDFNNMLSGIMGAADLLRLKADPELMPLITIISTAADRAGELILKLLAFSRKEKIALDPVDIHTIIGDTVEILKHTLDKKISVYIELEAKRHVIMGDLSQLHNGLLNIGINAGHAMPTGGNLTFTTRVIKLDPLFCEQSQFDLTPGWFVQTTIRDDGCGIPIAHRKRIFEPFFTTKQESSGTGLGLAAVYGTVVQHNGAISVYSEVDLGTEFQLLFPLCDKSLTKDLKTEATITGEGLVLIVDDEPVVRATARLMLERLGYETMEAENGQEGVELYRQHQNSIQLILLDMIMPVMDGTECFNALRKINPKARVIISSGFSRDADLADLKQRGLGGFIRKPYNMAELSKIVSLTFATDQQTGTS